MKKIKLILLLLVSQSFIVQAQSNSIKLLATPNSSPGETLEKISTSDNSSENIKQNNIWNGTIDDNWDNPGNWSLGVVPQGDNVEIPNTGNLYNPIIYSSVVTDSLVIHPNASLTIAPGGNLITNGQLINNGTFLIESDSNGFSGSFIDYGEMEGTGSFEFNRHIMNSSMMYDPSAWHYFSSPIDGFNTDAVPDYFVNTWNEISGQWLHLGSIEPCLPVSPPVEIDQMQGWSIKLDPDYYTNCGFGTEEIIEMHGTNFNSGGYSLPFSYSNEEPIAGWNFFGNPYPCSIDHNLISWPENLNQSIYIWDGKLNNFSTWAGGVGVQSIQPTQGFFLKSFGDGTFALSGDERVHDTETPWLKNEIDNLLTLKASNVDNEYYDLTHIRFLEEATSEFDKEWDAYKLLSITDEVPQIYTSTSNDIISINTLPLTNMVPLAFESVSSGTFSIEAIETSEFDFIVLEDLFTGEQIDLLTGSYTFYYTEGDEQDRFLIHFMLTGTSNRNKENIWIGVDNSNIVVSFDGSINGEIIIYDIIGKEIIRRPINSNKTLIPITQKNTFYIIEVLTGHDRIVKKVLVK